MAASGGIFQLLHDGLKDAIVQNADTALASFAAYMSTPARSALVLAVMFTGLHVAFGVGSQGVGRLAWNLVRWAFVAWVITDAAFYSTYVKDLFLTVLPDGLASAVSGTLGAASFDTALLKAWGSVQKIGAKTSYFDVGTWVVLGLFLVACIVSLVATYAIWLGTYILLAVLVTVSPVFGPLLLFGYGRRLVQNYGGVLIGCVLLQVVTLALAVFTLDVETALLASIAASKNSNPQAELWDVVKGIVLFAFVSAILYHLPRVVASITGAAQAEAGHAIAAFSAPAQRAARVAKAAAGGVAGQIARDFPAAGRAMAFVSAGASVGDGRRAVPRPTP